MHYHIDMITRGWPLLNQSSALVGTVQWHSTFLKQADRAGREPGRLAFQTETLTTVLFPRPAKLDVLCR